MTPQRSRLLLLAILLLAFALRVTNLGAQELRGDESFGYFFMQQDYRAIIDQTIALDEPHPVASYFVQKPWMQMAGVSEYAQRFPGVLFSVLAVVLLARLGRRLQLAPAAVLVAAGLLALSPYAIWHSQDARMYSMALALTIALVWLAIEALSRRRWQWVAAYIAVTLLALHTHYFVAYILIALTLFVLGRALVVPSARRALFDWILWNGIAFFLYAPWLLMARNILAGYGGNGDSPALHNALTRALSVFAVGETLPADQRIWWGLLAAALILLASLRLWSGTPNDRRTLWLLLCYLFVPLLLTWYSAQSRPIFNERYLIAAAPPFYLLAGATLQRAPRRRALDLIAAAGLLLLAAGMILSLWRYNVEPAWSKSRGWREVAARATTLGAAFAPEHLRFAQNYPDPTLWYYLPIDPHLTLPPAALDADAADAAVAQLANAEIQRVILIEQSSPTWDDAPTLDAAANGIAARALESHYDRIARVPSGNFAIGVFDRTPATFAPHETYFADIFTLTGIATAPAQLAPNDVLSVHLRWQSLPILPDAPFNITVQLLGPAGSVVTQQDSPLAVPTGAEPVTAYGILLPAELAPGDYRLIAAIYDPAADGLPRLLTLDGSDSVELATWHIQ